MPLQKKNLDIYQSPKQKCDKFTIECVDAKVYQLKDYNTVFHFYHPVPVNVLKEMLSNISSTFKANGKKVLIVYICPDGHFKIPHLWPGQNPPATE